MPSLLQQALRERDAYARIAFYVSDKSVLVHVLDISGPSPPNGE